jgi:hypothetical protein
MENKVEYIMIKELTKRENRKNIIKFISGGILFALLSYIAMYMFLFFILWTDEITDKIIGYF